MSLTSRLDGSCGSAASTLVLGGAGFIGTRLVPLLVGHQESVRIGDLKPSRLFSDLWIECDVRRYDSVLSAVQGVKTILNLAAEHRDDVRPLSRYYETNVQGAKNVCNAARAGGVNRIVFTSSVAVFGFQSSAADEDAPFAPFNEYGKTKLAAEQVYREWANEDPARTLVIVRPTVVFGEGNRGNVYNLIRQISTGRFLMVGTGDNVKSMAYVGNLAAFLVHSLSLPPGEHIFNYVDHPDLCTRELVELIRKHLGRVEDIRSVPLGVALAGGRILDAVAKVSGRAFPISAIRIRKFSENTRFLGKKAFASGFTPPYSIHEALARTIAFEFQNPTDAEKPVPHSFSEP